MNKLYLSLLIICISVMAVSASFPEKAEPRLYVNDWPVFSISYPSDWIAKTPEQHKVAFKAQSPQGLPVLRVSVLPIMPESLDCSTQIIISQLSVIGKDIMVLSDKETRLEDGTAAREAKIEWVFNGTKLSTLFLTAKKENIWIIVSIADSKATISEDLKNIAYSLKIKSGEEETVKVPADIQEFLNQYSSDIDSHDIPNIMFHYSNRFLDNGISRQGVEAFLKVTISAYNISSFTPNITKFEMLDSSKAYLAGFIVINDSVKIPLKAVIVKENWKWIFYGNQKQKQI